MLRTILPYCLLLLHSIAQGQPANTVHTTQGPESADQLFQKGILEKQNGRRLESMKYFEKAAQYDQENKMIFHELASAYFELRKYHQARDAYKKLVALGESSAANYKQLLQLSHQLKQTNDILFYADKLKAADPNEKVLYFVGKAYYDMDDYANAIKYLTLAVNEDPVNPEIPYLIAHSYTDMQNYSQSIPFFKKAIELKPGEARWMYELGLIYYAIRSDKESLQYILMAGEKGLKKDNDYLENLGIAYLNVGNLEEGAKMIEGILEKRPSDLNLLNMMAEVHYDKGKFDQAISYWDRMLKVDMSNASALFMIGMSYQKKGGKENKEKGVALCDKAIELDPALSSHKQKKQMPGL